MWYLIFKLVLIVLAVIGVGLFRHEICVGDVILCTFVVIFFPLIFNIAIALLIFYVLSLIWEELDNSNFGNKTIWKKKK